MAQRRSGRKVYTTDHRRTIYLEGSAARQLRVAYDAEKLPKKKDAQ